MGISTNTRLLGVAIIEKNGLVDYSVRLHKSSWSPSKANLITASLEPCVRQYSIKRVVLSIPPRHHQTKAFTALRTHLEQYFARKKIPIACESIDSIYRACANDAPPNKKEVMRTLSLRFPELHGFYQKELRNKNRYYVKMFEAVGIAVLHCQRQ